MRKILYLFVEPTRLFTELKENSSWIPSFIIVSLISIIIALLLKPAQTQLVIQQFQNKLNPEQIEQALSQSRPFSIAGLTFTPLLILMKWTLLSGLILLGVFIFNDSFQFKQSFSIISYSSLIPLMGKIFNTGIIYLNGIYTVNSPHDLNTIGLNIFFTPESVGIGFYSFFSAMSVFSIWYIVVVAIGLMVMANLDRVWAGFVSTFIWILTTTTKVGMVLIAQSFNTI